MKDDIAARIAANPKYEKLVNMRSSYSITMTILVMVVYYGYILLIAFNKEWLGTKLGAGMTTSIGIPMVFYFHWLVLQPKDYDERDWASDQT